MPKSSNIRTGRTFFALRSLSENQKTEIDGNKLLVFNLTMQCLDKIIRKINTKTNTSANAHHFALKNRVSFKAADNRTLKTGYIINLFKKYVSIVHCNDIFDEGLDVKKNGECKGESYSPFCGRSRGDGG
jgi:hypothetical protein